MGWHFRQSFKIIPGLKLNLSRTGLSASISSGPLTVNVGPHGLTGTSSIPGTGISYREHFDFATHSTDSHVPSSNPDGQETTPAQHYPATINSAPLEEIRSASTELLTSDSLKELKSLMQMTFEERKDISQQLDSVRHKKIRASTRYQSWERGFIFKRLFKGAFAQRKSEYETATAQVAELEEQLRLTTVATHVDIEKEQAEPYFRMRDDFARLCECSAIWDIKSHQATDQFHERTTATRRIDRQRVTFALDSCDLIQWEQKVPHLRNAKGGDLYLYPGFILYRAAKEAFSVIDYHDVDGNAIAVRFQEEEGVPSDSKVVGQTWAKANKDGSRDRRFADNYQIPIALYGSVTFKSASGLWEEFQLSNPERLTLFLNSLNTFVSSFGTAKASATA
ncbi:MAG TPA: DUF4236 domain-containing protein [Candidatus Angelobacter sp.]|nr:DUF4236 domain-containing protein [Candidatus Angelobacter sp.]